MIKICGSNKLFQLGEKPTIEGVLGESIISPPIDSSLDAKTVSSFSIYMDHSVVILTNGQILAAGDNRDGRIINSLPKQVLTQFTKFEIIGSSSISWHPVSCVCGHLYTLYLVSSSKSSNDYQLVYSHSNSNSVFPLFLNIGNSSRFHFLGDDQIQQRSTPMAPSSSYQSRFTSLHQSSSSRTFFLKAKKRLVLPVWTM